MRCPSKRPSVLGRMNFESPYVDMPMRLTVRQNLTIFGRLYAVANLRDRIAQLAADLDLGDFLDRANGKLSAGQKTRVALAKALINQPELLLLDEPTASLDPDTADWIRQHLETYRKSPWRDDPAGLAQHAGGRAAVRPRHHHEARQASRTTTRPTASWRATTAPRWKKCFSTSPAAGHETPAGAAPSGVAAS